MRKRLTALLVVAGLLVSGTAAAEPVLSVSATANASGLTLDGQGSSTTRIVKVADVGVTSIGTNGVTLSISSGNLTKAGGTSIPFQVTLVDDGAAAPAPSDFTVASGSTYQLVTQGLTSSIAKDLYIMYRGKDLQDPGAYDATISIMVVDN